MTSPAYHLGPSPRRLVALTLCLEDAVTASNWNLVRELLAERGSLIAGMTEAGAAIDVQTLEVLKDSEVRTVGTLQGRRKGVLDRLRRLRKKSQVATAYDTRTASGF